MAVIVIGAGPAGTRAAERLAEAGLRPIIIDESERQGGQIYRRQPQNFTRPSEKLYGTEAPKAVALHRAFSALAERVEYRPRTLVWANRPGTLLTLCDDVVEEIPYEALIVASGATDRIMPFPGWTTPGVYSLGAAQIALKAQACAVGEHPIFLGTGPLLYLVAFQYLQAGVTPRAVLDTNTLRQRLAAFPALAARPGLLARGASYMRTLRAAGVRLESGMRPLEALQAEGQLVGLRWQDTGGRVHESAADALAFGYGLRSETQIADLLKCAFTHDPVAKQWLPVVDEDGRSSVPGVYLAGDGALVRGADAAELAGRLAACAALQDRGMQGLEHEMAQLRRKLRPMTRFRRGLERAFPWPAEQAATLPDDTMICRCEGVRAGDIRRAATDLDTPEINRAKSFVRPGMGRCQGRICGLAAVEILAHARGTAAASVGRLRGAAPIKPLPVTARMREPQA